MKRIIGLTLLVGVLLAACAPRVQPVTDRDGDTVTITLHAAVALYDVTLHAFDAATTDERCVVMNVTDVACAVGDVPEGETLTVDVTGAPGAVECIAFAFTDPDLTVGSYRPYFCSHSGGA